jgi:hypothetical protein
MGWLGIFILILVQSLLSVFAFGNDWIFPLCIWFILFLIFLVRCKFDLEKMQKYIHVHLFVFSFIVSVFSAGSGDIFLCGYLFVLTFTFFTLGFSVLNRAK